MKKQFHWKGSVPQLYTLNKDWNLPEEIAEELGLKLKFVDVVNFSDEEFKTISQGDCRRGEIYLFAENTPAKKFVECLFALDSFRRVGVSEINLVFPYPGWLRQDRIKKPHESLNAKVIYGIFDQHPSVARFILMDPHTEKANLAVDKPWDPLFSAQFLLRKLSDIKLDPKQTTIVSSDLGISHTAKYIAKKFGSNLATILKDRIDDQEVIVTGLMVEGQVQKTVVLVDDIISTFGTGSKDIEYLRENYQIDKVYFFAPHALLVGPAMERLRKSNITQLFTTNTVPISNEKLSFQHMEVISVAEIFANAIYAVHNGESISKLYDVALRK